MLIHFVGCSYHGPRSTTFLFKVFFMLLLIVSELIFRKNIVISLCSSTELTSSSSSSFLSRYTAIFVAILETLLHSDAYHAAHDQMTSEISNSVLLHVTFILPASSIVHTILETFIPSSQK